MTCGDHAFSPATFIGKWKNAEPKEFPSCLIPCLLVVFTRQLEILVTAQMQILLNLIEYFVKRLGLGETFNTVHLSARVTCTLTCVKVTCILDPPHIHFKLCKLGNHFRIKVKSDLVLPN